MIEFQTLKQSKISRARLGILKTAHGEVGTPCLVPVATQAVVKTLTSEEVVYAGSQILITNTFHLHLKPGEKIVKVNGGLHSFMNWPRPLMTDSGGFQVFSLGFGKDFGVTKISKRQSDTEIRKDQQPQHLKISDGGVEFRSPVDGRKVFLGPKESIHIQEALGADIMFAFDKCPPPHASHAYIKKSIERTHRWAEQSLEARKSKQALYGIVQGGRFKDLRIGSAEFIAKLPFDGFGIGGEFGASKPKLEQMLRWITAKLPPEKPRHLLGIGHPEDIPRLIRAGVDTFDCIAPTHYARRGIAFTSQGRLNLAKSKFLKDRNPLDPECECEVCQNYSRSYISHLLRAKEITPLRLLTFHNLWYFNTLVTKLRNEIKKGRF